MRVPADVGQRVAVLLSEDDASLPDLLGVGEIAAVIRIAVVREGVDRRQLAARDRPSLAEERRRVLHRVDAVGIVEARRHRATVLLDGSDRLLVRPLHLQVDSRLEDVGTLVGTHTITNGSCSE